MIFSSESNARRFPFQEIQSVTDTWMIVPNLVRKLIDLDTGEGRMLFTREELLKLTIDCKHAYQLEFCSLSERDKGSQASHKDREVEGFDQGFESESTIEMTEEEIDLAFKGLAPL